jgi:hypothetical protein
MSTKRHDWFRPWAERGYRMELRRSGHYVVRSPAGRYVTTVAATPGDRRWLANTRATLRRFERRGGAA